MSKTIPSDVEASAIQDYLSQNPDALVYNIANIKFPVPMTIRQWGVVDEDLSVKKEDVVGIINEKVSHYDFGKFISIIISDPSPTQSLIGSVICNIFIDLLSYHKEVETIIAQITRDEAIARESVSMMKRLDKQFNKQPKDFAEVDLISLKEMLEAPENIKNKDSFEKRLIAIDVSFKEKVGTPIKKGTIQVGIEDKARDFTFTVVKKLWNEASRFIVIKQKEPIKRT
jgi:hypothetical protein